MLKSTLLAQLLLPAALVLASQAGCRHSQKRDEGPITPLAGGPDLKPGEAEKELPTKESAKLCMTMAEHMEQKGHDLEAAAEFERARQHDPKLKISRRLGMCYERMGEFKQAQTEYERAIKEAPKDPAPLNDLGYLHYARGRFDEAEKFFRDAIKMKPDYARAWINLGLTMGQQQKFDEALEAFQHAVSPGEAYANLAFVYLAHGKRDEAKQMYREALKKEPDLRVARAAIAKLEAPPTDTQVRQVAAFETKAQ